MNLFNQLQIQDFDKFFNEFQALYLPYEEPQHTNLSTSNVDFFSDFSKHWMEHIRLGAEANIWSISGLKRDEIRNAAVLAWFLDPKGSHGQGNLFLRKISSMFSDEDSDLWKNLFDTNAHVYLEYCPQGDRKSRVDIAIEGPKFLFYIEVKIDAREQDHQLERYFEIARKKAGRLSLPFKVSYLTPSGRRPTGDGLEDVICFSWKDCAQAFTDIVEQGDLLGSPFIKQIVIQFCDHIDQL